MVYFLGKGLALEKSTMTNTSKLSTLAFLVVSLSASAAFAENPVAPIPQHAPQNISQINGQLVEVGNHNKYDYSYKKFNIGTNPLGLIAGMTSIQGSVAINSMVALRGDFVLYTDKDIGKGAEFTASAAIYFRQMYSGFYIEPGLMYRSLEKEGYDALSFSSDSNTPRTDTTGGFQTLMGYHWMWDSGLNVAVAAGIGRDMTKKSEDSYDDDVFFNGYMRAGYAF